MNLIIFIIIMNYEFNNIYYELSSKLLKKLTTFIGPAGAGKSTFCSTLITHCLSLSPPRCLHLVNLDPAAEYSSWKRSDLSQSEQSEKPYYTPSVDIQELVDLESVMEQLQLG